VLGKGGCAGERTEVVRLLVQAQAADRVLWIDCHLADRVDRQMLGALVRANDRENLDRLSNVSQDLPPARLVKHSLEIRGERCRVAGDKQLAAGRERTVFTYSPSTGGSSA
jgi:hypothetical protein